MRFLPRVGRWLIVLIELHGQGTCGIPHQQCPQKYDAQPWATLVLATGVAALLAGLGLYLRDRVSAIARSRYTRAA